ncbi:HAD family hydrolase [Algivirga pacifica]|uniref:phosphoglycolate phosphatase n=1 Tax=Algivirga pacifica TaxID=1162670 RepID=A0ABP9D042_9BACT
MLPKNKEYKAIIFDLDGTLYDNRKVKKSFLLTRFIFSSYLWKLEKARQQAHIKSQPISHFSSSDNTLPHFSEHPYYQQLAVALDKSNPAKAHHWYEKVFYPTFVNALKPQWVFPKMVECLSYWKKQGIRLAVLSDYHFIGERLSRLQIPIDLFERLHSAEQSGVLKPDPWAFQQLIQDIGVKKEEVLIVGDREDKDGEAARAMGVDFFRIHSAQDWDSLYNKLS